jgi:hypothetical protein
MPPDHHWKPESWRSMNEEEYLRDAPQHYNRSEYTPTMTKQQEREMLEK